MVRGGALPARSGVVPQYIPAPRCATRGLLISISLRAYRGRYTISTPSIQTALNAGELSPSLYGRVDLDKYRKGCSTLRNMFASYRGGVLSRAGTLFCGQCQQGSLNTANSVAPPRNIAFQYSATQGIVIEAGDNYFRFVTNGAYITNVPVSITAISTGFPTTITAPAHGFASGATVFLSNISGIPSISDQSFLAEIVTTNTFVISSALDGDFVTTPSTDTYAGGGTAASIYELATPYAAVDLPYLKWSQSADVMSFTCVNPTTGSEYPPYDLARISSADWTLTQTQFGSSIAAPDSTSVSQECGTTTLDFYYQFVVTAVDAATGEESQASPVATVLTCDQSVIAGSISIVADSVAGAGSYNFYGATPAFQNPPNPGAIFGYLGSAFGPTFTDTNIIANFTTSPPLHTNPFATSSITAIEMSAGGSSYSPTATTATVTSPIGQNPILTPIIVDGGIVWTSVLSGGAGFTGGEAITFTDSTGSGSGAAGSLVIGPSTGTFPSCVAYFQERRFYANTLNNPDTYFGSQPGAFTNMDTSLPTTDSDAIVGSPWSQQVNGIQWMINMPGGLVVLTGLGAWQLSGTTFGAATGAALTPSNQVANPQAYNGCSPTVPPIVVNYDILYVQEKGSIVRDLSYNFFVNIYTGTDMTVLSNHMFDGHQILQWAWAEEPNKLIWAVRDDGILLCLTFLKEQDVYAWSRHDTNGLFQSVCSVSEPPVNAIYVITKRLIQNDGNPVWAYYQERMDNRIWTSHENVWCVDAGLQYVQNTPNATLTISSASGTPTLQSPVVIYGGTNYGTGTYAEIVDPTGTGATISLTVHSGVVTAASVGGNLVGYTAPQIVVIDPTGAGGNAAISIQVLNIATVQATAAVFADAPGQGEAGDVIRMSYGGRLCDVTQYLTATELQVSVVRDYTPVIPNDPYNTPIPAPAGQWTIAAPIQTVYGLGHLEGMTVSILADGIVIDPMVVSNGTVTLPQPASNIVIGLGFAVQMQTMYLELPGPETVQGRRKEIDQVIVRVDDTALPFDIGVNQPDASIQPGQVTVPWTNMTGIQGNAGTPNPNAPFPTDAAVSLEPYTLFSGDLFANVFDQMWVTAGQVAIQQLAPQPLTVLAVIPWSRIYDDAGP